ncbi:FecR domain-containing protein [Pseudomonadota bacterium]
MTRTFSLSFLLRQALYLAMLAFLALSFAALPALNDDAWGAEVIGKINKQRADVYGTPPEDDRERKFPRYSVVFGELIETAGGAAVLIDMKDGTELMLGERAKLVIDEFVYDPETKTGKAVYNFTIGTLRFVSGDMAGTGVTIATPTAYIGIRGSEAIIFVTPDGSTTVNVTKGTFRVRSHDRDRPPVEIDANENVSVDRSAGFSPVGTGVKIPEYSHDPGDKVPDFSDDLSDIEEGGGFDKASEGQRHPEEGHDDNDHDHGH